MSQASFLGKFMPIKKVTCPEEFKKVWLDLDSVFKNENQKYGHQLHRISAESVINSWANPSLLNHVMHTWANFENGCADGIIMFTDSINTVCGERTFNEFFWISNNPKTSFSLLNKALNFARSKKIKFVNISCVENHPKSYKLKKIYEKLGFKKDCETYSIKL